MTQQLTKENCKRIFEECLLNDPITQKDLYVRLEDDRYIEQHITTPFLFIQLYRRLLIGVLQSPD